MSLFRDNPELRACFESDATNLLQRLQECLELLTRDEIQLDQFEVAQELAHTLRGASALVGAKSIARVCGDFMRLFEIADTFKFSALDQAIEIFRFARQNLDALLSAVIDCLGDQLEPMDRTCESIHQAALGRWGDYFYQTPPESAEPAGDATPTSAAQANPQEKADDVRPGSGSDRARELADEFIDSLPESPQPAGDEPAPPTLTLLPDPEPAERAVQPAVLLDDFLSAVGDGLSPGPVSTASEPVGFLPSEAPGPGSGNGPDNTGSASPPFSSPASFRSKESAGGPARDDSPHPEASELTEDFLGAVADATTGSPVNPVDDFIESVTPSHAPEPVDAPAGPGSAPPSAPALGTSGGVPALEVEADLLPYFYEDALTNLESLEGALHRWEDDDGDRDALQAIYRHTHTIKGAANSTGLLPIGRLTHAVEDALEERLEGRLPVAHSTLVSLIYSLADAIKAGIQELQGRGTLQESLAVFDRIIEQVGTIRTSRPAPAVTTADAPAAPALPAAPAATTESAARAGRKAKVPRAPSSEPTPAADAQLLPATGPVDLVPARRTPAGPVRVEKEGAETLDQQSIRITSQRLDALMNLIGELVVNRTRLDKKIVDIARLQEELNFCKARLLDAIGGFQERFEYSRRQKRWTGGRGASDLKALGLVENAPGFNPATSPVPGDFSELEFDRYDDFNILARSLIEIGNDTSEIISQLDLLFGSFSEESGQFNKTTTELQNEVTRVRMVPLTFLFRRLQRAVRDAAHREQKQVEFSVSGSETQLDKVIVDQIYPPLLHLVRNAVSHGLEAPPARHEAKKTPAGRVSVKAYQQANQVVIEVADDGRGLNFSTIRDTAVRQGLLSPDAQPTEEELTNLIFRPGFSTAAAVSEVSGRGVGMDVVMAVVSHLNGTVAVESQPGAGCRFVLRLPLTLAINQAMMIAVGEATYAVPLSFVEHIVPFQAGAVHVSGDTELWIFRDLSMPLVRLDRLFGLPPAETQHANVVQVRVANKVLALLVGSRLSKQDIVVKSLGRLLDGHRYFSGATLSGDGNVILILDLPGLESAVRGTAVSVHRTDNRDFAPRPAGASTRRRILVVDDSLSVRKVAEKYLQALGYETVLAVDGLDALEKLRSEPVSLVLTDLEMPRLHGFELVAEIRHQPALNQTPIIVVTSRDAEKHRNRARALGANDYITKPFSRDQLAQRIDRLFGAVVNAEP